jgi:NAD(P)-dependent dehydrogenase (short-subunit alcohol dehydrogenase family)
MKINLAGKVAYVSGGASGIGAAIAQTFAEQGACVAIGDVQSERGEATAARIRERGGKAVFLRHDTTEEAQWAAALAQTVEQLGGLDILVNNAAIEQTGFLADVDPVDVQKLVAVNITGVILGHKHAIRAMRPGGAAGRGGSIINLSSVAGLIGTPGLGVYSASKGAVRLLSKAAAVECGRLGYGIRVNSIHPGLVETDMGNKLVDDFVQLGVFPDRDSALQQMLATYPLGRTGVPGDIANAALFLASNLSSWVTGTEIVVDGGMTIS